LVHCIGSAVEQIQWGKQDIMFAGGGEEVEWTMSSLFDAMGAMSSKYNDSPETASRAFDTTRDGFVIAGGAGMIVLEEYEHAKSRGAKIYAEVTSIRMQPRPPLEISPKPKLYIAFLEKKGLMSLPLSA